MEYNGNPESVGYKIKYSRADGRSKTLSHVVRDRLEREHTIEDLEEWTEYRVQVQAFNAIGSGPWSPMVVGRTRESGTARWSQPPGDSPPPACGSLPSGLPRGTKAGAVVRHGLGSVSCLCPAERPGLSPCLPAPDPTYPIPTAPHVPTGPTSKPSALTLTQWDLKNLRCGGLGLALRTFQKHNQQLTGACKGSPTERETLP